MEIAKIERSYDSSTDLAYEAFKKIFSDNNAINKLRNILEERQSPFLTHIYMHYYNLAAKKEFGRGLQVKILKFHINSNYISDNYFNDPGFEYSQSSIIAVLRKPKIYDLLKKPASEFKEIEILDLLIEGSMNVFRNYLKNKLNKYPSNLGYEDIDMIYVDQDLRQDIDFGHISKQHEQFVLSKMTHVEKLDKYLQHVIFQENSQSLVK